MEPMNSQKRTLFSMVAVLLLLFFTAACQTIGSPPKPQLIQWRTLAQGTKEAREKGMPILIDFYAGFVCPRCNYFDSTLYTDPDIADMMNRNFIPVRVDLNRARTKAEGDLLMKLSPMQECVLAFLDKNGKIVTDKKGVPISSMEKLNKQQYMDYMKQALANLH